jgi:hypothetical protein
LKLLLLKGYNNYQNRWLKYENSLSAYRTAVGENNYYDYTTDINFNINDGISTTITLNLTDIAKPNFMSDYVIVYEDNSIMHRWFVIEQVWNRKSQYVLTLKRDVLVDFREQYQSAPMLVSKGYPANNTFELYNNEGIQYSQVKKFQMDLGDTNLMWLVCYLNKNRRGIDNSFITRSSINDSVGYPGYVKHISSKVEADRFTIRDKYLWVKGTNNGFETGSEFIANVPDSLGPFEPIEGGVTKDTAYDILVFPLPKSKNIFIQLLNPVVGTWSGSEVERDTILSAVTNLKYAMQDDMYDVQILPYCPLSDVTITEETNFYRIKSDDAQLYNSAVRTWDLVLKFSDDSPTSELDLKNSDFSPSNAFYGLFAKSKDLTVYKSFNYPYAVTSTEDKKIDSECRFVRICSPAGKSMWDYNVVKNNSNTSYVINMTLKPGQPYMHIRPQFFSGVYGQTFEDDARGVIDTSSYSLTTIIDSWMQYVQQNNNFQDIFNRNIDSMEVKHNIALGLDITNAVFGSISASASGGLTGAMVGGVPGAIVGAVAGGVTSLGGGIADTVVNQTLRDEQMSLTKDLYSLNLAQIKARPDTISKLSNIDIDSHLVPYAEIYSASNDEIEYLRNLLTYRGYTINRIKSVSQEKLNAGADKQQSLFVSGRLLECPGLQEDAHVFSEINNELMTGVRIFL